MYGLPSLDAIGYLYGLAIVAKPDGPGAGHPVMSFRSASTATNTGASVTINAPAGLTQGDQLIAMIASGDFSVTYSAPSGWTALSAVLNPIPITGKNLPTQLFQKVAGASEPGSYTFTTTASQSLIAVIVDYTGVTVDISATVIGNSVSSLAGASVTTTQPSESVVAFWAEAFGSATAISLPGGLTSRASLTTAGPASENYSLAVGDYTGPGTAGSTSPGTATGATGAWVSLTVCLKTPAPAAPTLLTPANGAYLDIAASGGPFTVQYNSNGSLGGETGYHFRRKLSGGSYSYWNAATPAFQSSDVANTSTSMSLTFPSAAWTDGNTYSWSWASVDAGGTGPYAADFVVNSQVGPSVTVSAPTGTWATNQTPTVTWSDSLAPGGAQLTYRVVTYSPAQYSAPGFTPGVGPSLDDSGVVNGSAATYTVATPIPNGTAVESYVQITQTPGGQLSAWAFTAYTIMLDTPATPTITAVAGNDPTTGCPRVVITVQCQDNFLTANQSSLSAGNTTGWTAGGGTTLTAVTSPAPPSGESSAFVMKMAGAGALSAQTPTGTSGFAILPSTQYSALASFRSASTGRSCTAAINWYTAGGALISSSTSGAITDTSSGWTQALITASSPSNAAWAAVTVAVASAAENHFVTEIGLMPGTDSTWSMGGFVGSTTVSILRSDGLYVRYASTANPAIVPAPSQTVVEYDLEATPTTSYTYTAVVSVVLGGAAGTLASAPATSGAAIVPGGQGFWEIDPTNYSSAVNGNPTQWNPSQIEQSAAHKVLNQTTANVVAASMQAPDFSATFETFSAAPYQALLALATSQKTIFISDPFGLSYYFRLALAPGGMSGGIGSTAHSTQLQGSSAAAPHRVVAVTGIAQPRPFV